MAKEDSMTKGIDHLAHCPLFFDGELGELPAVTAEAPGWATSVIHSASSGE